MYEHYIDFDGIPASDILKRILTKENITRQQFALDLNISAQWLDDFILGKEKITPELSLKLEII